MALDNKEVLGNLITQQKELMNTIQELSTNLENTRSQYLKVSGAVEVLQQIESESEVTEEVPEEEWLFSIQT